MINVLSYIGMNARSEACLWTLLGLFRTIFDATLFRVNADLKQVWQISMPDELSTSVQRVLRTMISGVILVQCFTVYVYLASYIVLMYPVFLEERPTLVLPWLLLAAVRKLLCELTSLALGLGTCVLLGPARPPCIKFVIIKVISIMPSFYMWMLLFSYYHTLKITAAFKTFPAVLPSGDQDYGLELAIRRRRTKSLLGEDQLRSKIVANLYGEQNSVSEVTAKLSKIGISSRMMHSTDTSAIDLLKADTVPNSFSSNRMSDTGEYEDWFGSEVVLPRSCDRVLEQFALMLLRIKVYMDKEGVQTLNSHMFNSKSSRPSMSNYDDMHCASIATDDTDTPFQVGSNRYSNTASYLQEYPQIFMKKAADLPRNDNTIESITMQTRQETDDNGKTTRSRRRTVTVSSKEIVTYEEERVVSQRKYMPVDKNRNEYKPSLTTSKETVNSLKKIKINDSDSSTTRTSVQNEVTNEVQEENGHNSIDVEHNRGIKGLNDENIENEHKDQSNDDELHKENKPSTSDNEKILKEQPTNDKNSDDDIKRSNDG